MHADRRSLFVVGLLLYSCASHGPPTPDGETVASGIVQIVPELREPPDVEAHSDAFGLEGVRIPVEPGVSLYVIDEGEGIPIVLLNGGPGNSLQSFVPHFSRAAAMARVIYYDPRGVGRSDWEPGPDGYSTPQAIADLERLREALGVERWVVLGWSWGGLLAQRYALQHPDRVLGLVLVTASESMGLERANDTYPDHLSDVERERLAELYHLDGQRVVPLHSDAVSGAMVRKLVFNGYLNGDWKRQFYVRPTTERIAHVAQHEWRHDANYNPQMRASFERIPAGAFADFAQPVLLIYGSWDMSFAREMPERLAAEFPRAELHVFERSSHHPFASEPERFFGVLERWLLELGGRVLPVYSGASCAQGDALSIPTPSG